MIKITTTDGDILSIGTSRIKAIQRAVGSSITEIVTKTGKRYTTADDIPTILATNCPTTLLECTSSLDGAKFLYPIHTIETIEAKVPSGSRIIFHTDRTERTAEARIS